MPPSERQNRTHQDTQQVDIEVEDVEERLPRVVSWLQEGLRPHPADEHGEVGEEGNCEKMRDVEDEEEVPGGG